MSWLLVFAFVLAVVLAAVWAVRCRRVCTPYPGVNPPIIEFLSTELNRFPLHQAVFKNDFSAVERLLKEGSSLSEETDDGQTPLHIAAECGLHYMCRLLIKRGVEIDALDNFGGTALHAAAACQSGVKVIKVLLKHGADFRIKDAAGMTPCQLADKYKHYKISAYLKFYGA